MNDELKSLFDSFNIVEDSKSNGGPGTGPAISTGSDNSTSSDNKDKPDISLRAARASDFITAKTAEIMSVNSDQRFNPDGAKGSDILKLRDHQQEILRLISTGMKPKAIAMTLGIHVQTVVNARNSDLGQAMLQMLHSERNITISKTTERIDALAPLAVDVFEKIMVDENIDISIQHRAARDTLKAAGIMVDHKKVDHGYLTSDEVRDLKSKFTKDFDGNMEDVEFTVTESNQSGEGEER